MQKLYLTSDWQHLSLECATWKKVKEVLVFTNGCFDGLHAGHLALLKYARSLGSRLIIGLNSDESVRRLKGGKRPLQSFKQRADALLKSGFVDVVVCFGQDTPAELISLLKPDVLVKGGDYTPDTIVGADVVKENGGRVEIFPRIPGYSTTENAKEKYDKS